MRWRKPIADRDSGIRVELTLVYPPFRNPANLETKSRLRGYETGLMKKGACSGYAFIAVLWTSPPESLDYARARSLAALAMEPTAGDSRPASRTRNHEWRGRYCRPSAWQPRDRSRQGIVSRPTESCTDGRG